MMLDLTGQKLGRLTVVEEAARYESPGGDKKRQWLCKCDCGNQIIASAGNLRNGRTTSCGCISKQKIAARNYKHGYAPKGHVSHEYTCWLAMKSRCGMTNYKHKETSSIYNNYQGRGITVCERWLRFESFLADMGPIPAPGYSIERKDNNQSYTPSNCAWLPKRDQSKNTRRSLRLTFNGQTRILADWARKLGIRSGTLGDRIRAGWSIEKAFTTPVHGSGVS